MTDSESSSYAARMMARHACATGQDACDVFELEAPTPEEVLQRERIAAQLKREESRPLPIPPPSPAEFRLVGSNRKADEIDQGSLF